MQRTNMAQGLRLRWVRSKRRVFVPLGAAEAHRAVAKTRAPQPPKIGRITWKQLETSNFCRWIILDKTLSSSHVVLTLCSFCDRQAA